LTLIDASLPTVVGVETVGGVGTPGVDTAGVVTAGVVTAGAGSAPAAVSDALAQPHASAQIGRPTTTTTRRNHVRRLEPVLPGSGGSDGRFDTQTLPGSSDAQWRAVRVRICSSIVFHVEAGLFAPEGAVQVLPSYKSMSAISKSPRFVT